MNDKRVYGGPGLIYDEDADKMVYVENSYWDEEYQGWRACAAIYQPLKTIRVNGQAVEVRHVVS